jgi:hypothetical protein
MAAPRAKAAFSARLQKGDGGSPEVFTTIAEVKDIEGPEIRSLFEEVTSMDSADGFAEKIPTTREASDVTFQVNMLQDDATQNGLRADLAAGTYRNFRLLLPPGYTKRISFGGYVQSIGQSAPVKGALTSAMSLVVTGKPILEANS